jgi:YebC/PmpR family DNA-binding regulatory protein
MFWRNISKFALHNRWSKVKHIKAARDPARATVGKKVSREITVAVRLEGPDPTSNFRLRLLMENARKMSIPKKLIETAISAGTGENAEVLFTKIYNSFGPNGIALLLICITDNFNRTTNELRKIIDMAGGSPGDAAWAFQQRGVLVYDRKENDDEFLEKALGMDPIDIDIQDAEMIVYCDPPRLKEFEAKLGAPKEMEFTYFPISPLGIEDDEAYENMQTLLNDLDDHPDVTHVYHNLEQRKLY